MDPALAQVIATLDETRFAANVYDAQWRLAHATGAQESNVRGAQRPGVHMLSSDFIHGLTVGGSVLPDDVIAFGSQLVPFVLAVYSCDRDELLALADPGYREAIESVTPLPMPPVWTATLRVQAGGGQSLPLRALVTPIRGVDGVFAGAVELWLPNLSGDLLTLLTLADTSHLERVGSVARPERRPSAILFADLEASTPLARRLSTESYFRLVRRVMRAVDNLVVASGGLVGRHVGDGLTAFYPAELAGGEGEAARAAVATARELQGAVAAAVEPVPNAGDVRINAGVHWGATVRIGAMVTAARFEVTALGEEVNEAARIEACATGGRVLVSKALIERLDDATVTELGIDPGVGYLPLAEVPGAPEKARRDAPLLAVRPL